ILRVLRVVAHGVQRPRIEATALTGRAVLHVDHAAVVAAERDVRVRRVRCHVARLTACRRIELRVRRRRSCRSATATTTTAATASTEARRLADRTALRARVLLRAADVER